MLLLSSSFGSFGSHEEIWVTLLFVATQMNTRTLGMEYSFSEKKEKEDIKMNY